MGTITITSAGFAALPASAPANWPAGITYPGSIAPNGSRQAILTDAEMVQLVTWAAASFSPNSTPTITQILVGWVGSFFQATKDSVQRYFTGPPTIPPPINLN